MVVGTGFEPVNRLPEQIYSLRALAACISHRSIKGSQEAKGRSCLCQGKIEDGSSFFQKPGGCGLPKAD